MNDNDNDNDKPTGPGNPPKEFRWKKGCPSPNPRGRPPKKKLEQMLAPLDKYAEMVDRLGSTMVPGPDGPHELRENYLRVIAGIATDKKMPAKERRAAAKLWSDIDREALRVLNKEMEQQFNNALNYKERWTPAFRLAESKGRPVPTQLPHPDDVVIVGARVTIVGPVDAEAQAHLEQNLATRKLLKAVFETMLVEGPSEGCTKNLKMARRYLAKINKLVPPRLIEPVPPMPKDTPVPT